MIKALIWFFGINQTKFRMNTAWWIMVVVWCYTVNLALCYYEVSTVFEKPTGFTMLLWLLMSIVWAGIFRFEQLQYERRK